MDISTIFSYLGSAKRKLVQQKEKFESTGLTPRYIWRASLEKRKFWMINTMFPENARGLSLQAAAKQAINKGEYVIHIGCGSTGEAILDLLHLGHHNLIGLDAKVPGKEYQGVEFIKTDLRSVLPVEDHTVKGVVFTSYIFAFLTPAEQLQLLQEIDRITTKGSMAFIGPLFPQHLTGTAFAKAFPKYKNPLFGFIEERNHRPNEVWTLHRSRMVNSSIILNPQDKPSKGIGVPLLRFSLLGSGVLSGRLLGKTEVIRDYKVHIPNDFYITFCKG